MTAAMKRIYYFGAGIALGVAATRRTRRAKEAAREALKAKVTPSAIAADVADAIAELGNAVGAFAADVRQGAINRRASYRPLVDNATGAVILVGAGGAGPGTRSRSSSARPVPRRPGPRRPGRSQRAGSPRRLGCRGCRPDRRAGSADASEPRSPAAGPSRADPERLAPSHAPSRSHITSARTHADPRDPAPLPRPLREDRPHRRAVGVADQPGRHRAVHHRRHGAVQAVLPRSDHPAVPAGDQRAEVRAHRWTSRTSASPPGTTRSSRWPATSPSATTSRTARSSTPGTLLTGSLDDGGYGLDPDRLWVTVYETDDEATQLWQKVAGLPPERIQRRGMADNFWSMGVPGPVRSVLGDLLRPRPRVRRRGRPGRRRGPLPGDLEPGLHAGHARRVRARRQGRLPDPRARCRKQNIDTGLGVERLAFLLQGVDNVYETDLLRPIIATDGGAVRASTYGADHAATTCGSG